MLYHIEGAGAGADERKSYHQPYKQHLESSLIRYIQRSTPSALSINIGSDPQTETLQFGILNPNQRCLLSQKWYFIYIEDLRLSTFF